MQKLLGINKLELNFGSKNFLEDFDAVVYAKQKIALIGNSGVGKSSLFKVINGELSPSGGEISVDKDVQIAYVPQLIDKYTWLKWCGTVYG